MLKGDKAGIYSHFKFREQEAADQQVYYTVYTIVVGLGI